MENIKIESINDNEIFLRYKINNDSDNKIKLFGKKFVELNKKSCRIIIDTKEYQICSHWDKNKIDQNKKILEVKLKINKPLSTVKDMFSNCDSLITFADNNLNTSKVIDTSYMFYECKQLFELSDISKWDTSKITDMNSMFKGCEQLSKIPNISQWDTSKVTDMNSMFQGCSCLLSLPDISRWNIINVTDVSCMFEGCSSISSFPDISKWNTKNINYMSDMFKGCASLSCLSDISKWDTSNLAFRNDIFRECLSLLILPKQMMSKELT
jgi:surface protein